MSQGLIQGSMRAAPLPDIIQLVSQSGKSGCFHVLDEPKRAKIYMKDGKLVHAVTNDAQGLDAVFEVALWLDGSYHFEEGSFEVVLSITKSNAAVLMEMHHRMDEWRVISQKISSLDLYPVSTLLPGETPHGINPRQAKLLGLITGWFTLAELAEVMQKPVLTVAKDLYDLVMTGQVLLKGMRSGRKPELPAEFAPTLPLAPEPSHVLPSLNLPPQRFQVAPELFEHGREGAPLLPPLPAPVAPKPPMAGAVTDPVKMSKLNAFAQRPHYHEMVNGLLAEATQRVNAGDGPEAVKNLALTISRRAVDAGCDAEMVKHLNAQLKALFSR
jgi:hypothetical protein